MPARPAAHVEQEVALPHPELVEADGQHAPICARHLEADPVLLDGLHGGVHPRPAVDDALAAAGADRAAEVVLLEGPAQLGGQRLAVARGHEHGGVAVGADDLGDGPAGGGHERHAAGHGLDGGEREALVERRHDGQLGLGVELDDPLLLDAGDELDVLLEARAS